MLATVRTAILAGLVVAACATAPRAPRTPAYAEVAQTAGLAVEARERGRLLASTACSGCHAIGTSGESRLADATPLREIVRRRSLDRLEAGFAEGLVTAHPAMPAYVFRASEIDDLIAYLESLKATR